MAQQSVQIDPTAVVHSFCELRVYCTFGNGIVKLRDSRSWSG